MELLTGRSDAKKESVAGSRNNTELVVLIEDSIYMVDTTHVDSVGDCFDYQCFGVLACRTCNCKNTTACEGGKVKESGVNAYGHKVPIAVKIGDRPKRDWNKAKKGMEDKQAELNEMYGYYDC